MTINKDSIHNIVTVMQRLVILAYDDEYLADLLIENLEPFLDSVASDDYFGTERQFDPRGDMRVKEWSLFDEIQGA